MSVRKIDCITGIDSADEGIIDLTKQSGFDMCVSALQKPKKIRFNWFREKDNEIHVVDHLQGSTTRVSSSQPIAIVYSAELAERIVKMLEEFPGYYEVR